MNIRFEAVHENGREIEADDDDRHPPMDNAYGDSIPRIGEEVMFYNTGGDLSVWTVVNVVWMADASDDSKRHGGFMHACVQIRRKPKDGSDA